jgi:hypothetical protein
VNTESPLLLESAAARPVLYTIGVVGFVLFSWWWAWWWPKHVETPINTSSFLHLVGYLFTFMIQDARRHMKLKFSKYYFYVCVCVCVCLCACVCVCVLLALVIQHAQCMRHTAIRGRSGFSIFFPHYLINGKVLKKVVKHKMRVLIFFTTFVWSISNSKKNWRRYDQKCVLFFI